MSTDHADSRDGHRYSDLCEAMTRVGHGLPELGFGGDPLDMVSDAPAAPRSGIRTAVAARFVAWALSRAPVRAAVLWRA